MLIMSMLSTLLTRPIPPYKNASPGVINSTSAELASIQAVSPVLGWPSVGKLTRYNLRSAANSRQADAWGLNQNLAHWLLQKATLKGFAGVTSLSKLNLEVEFSRGRSQGRRKPAPAGRRQVSQEGRRRKRQVRTARGRRVPLPIRPA